MGRLPELGKPSKRPFSTDSHVHADFKDRNASDIPKFAQ